jgi:hypothetical protein
MCIRDRYHRDGALDQAAPFVGDETILSHLRRVLVVQQIRVQVAFGQPLDPAQFDRRGLAARAREEIVATLEQLSASGST